MSAEKQPVPDNKKHDLITRFVEKYDEALSIARVGSEHTHTEGWQTLYRGQKEAHGVRRREIAKRMSDLASTIESIGSSEDTEKAIGECKKQAEALRKDIDSFDRQIVEPVSEPAHECRHIIEEYRRQARNDEQDAPLVNVGLEHLMRDAISKVAKVEWDAESGLLVITEPAD